MATLFYKIIPFPKEHKNFFFSWSLQRRVAIDQPRKKIDTWINFLKNSPEHEKEKNS
jgi:hypothetical protein